MNPEVRQLLGALTDLLQAVTLVVLAAAIATLRRKL